MRAKREYRNRETTEVAVLDELVNRTEDGMTVLELRAAVSVDIDELETALAELKADDLITVEQRGSRTVIRPDQQVIPDDSEPAERPSVIEQLRQRFPF